MTNILRGSIYPVLLGIVLVIVPAFVVVIATGFGFGKNWVWQDFIAVTDEAYVDVAETAEAGNVTTMMTNQTANRNTTTANLTS